MSLQMPVADLFRRLYRLSVIISTVVCAFFLFPVSAEEGVMESGSDSGGVVVIGASYAAGWSIESLAGMPVVNRGIGGQESHELLARFEEDVIGPEPRYVIIWGFINDIFRSDPQRIEARLERSRDDFRTMVSMARAAGVRPVLATEITMARPPGLVNTLRSWVGRLRGKESYGARVNGHVSVMNRWIREYAGGEGIPVLDLEAALADPDGWRRPEFATEDGSHVSAAGYEALTRYVRERWPVIVEAGQ